MPEPCLLDNDVVLKVAAYGLNIAAFSCLKSKDWDPAMLGVGKFVLRRKATKSGRFTLPERVSAELEALLELVRVVEPTEEEVTLAADLETSARQQGAALDVGEAQLFAILLLRGLPALITGDKRAVSAASLLGLTAAAGRIVCMEQLVACISQIVPTASLRNQICAEPLADRTLSICFACGSVDREELELQALLGALDSYVRHLRQQSGALLMAGCDTSALTT